MAKAQKIDLYKMHKTEYAAPKDPILVETKPTVYLGITGIGEPGGELFQNYVGALYSMAYTIKMTRKFEGLQDYVVCKLEGLWWLAGGSDDFSKAPRDQWRWKLMIRTPDFIAQSDLDRAVAALAKKGKSESV